MAKYPEGAGVADQVIDTLLRYDGIDFVYLDINRLEKHGGSVCALEIMQSFAKLIRDDKTTWTLSCPYPRDEKYGVVFRGLRRGPITVIVGMPKGHPIGKSLGRIIQRAMKRLTNIYVERTVGSVEEAIAKSLR